MGILLLIIYILFAITQIYLIIRFTRDKSIYYLKSTVWCFILLSLFLLAGAVLYWIKIPEYIYIFIMLTIFFHDYIGYHMNKYNESKMFDRLLHVFGSFTFALTFYYILIDLTKAQSSKIFLAIFAFVLGIALGTIFEIMEYSKDKKNSIKAQKGLKDTNVDLICDIIGSAAAALIVYLFIT